jgi:hypothetical protein
LKLNHWLILKSREALNANNIAKKEIGGPIFPADRASHFTIYPFADLLKGSSKRHYHDGMHEDLTGSKTCCFAGELYISGNIEKMQVRIAI